MEIPMTQPETAQETYKKGPDMPQQPQPQMTQEQIDERKSEMVKMFKRDTPFLRQQEEYNRLQLAIMEQEAMAGIRPISTIPGLLGAELMVREINALGQLANWRNEMDHQNKLRHEQEADEAKAASGTSNPNEQEIGSLKPLKDLKVDSSVEV